MADHGNTISYSNYNSALLNNNNNIIYWRRRAYTADGRRARCHNKPTKLANISYNVCIVKVW